MWEGKQRECLEVKVIPPKNKGKEPAPKKRRIPKGKRKSVKDLPLKGWVRGPNLQFRTREGG